MKNNTDNKSPVLITKTVRDHKIEKGFKVRDLIAFFRQVNVDTDIRIESLAGDELLETAEVNISSISGDSQDEGYQYVCLKFEESSNVHECVGEQLESLDQIRNALADYHRKLKNRENGHTAANAFIERVEELCDMVYGLYDFESESDKNILAEQFEFAERHGE